MIFRLTPEKVIGRINKLIDELGQYDLRIKKYEDQAQLAMSMGISSFGDDAEVREWRAALDEIYSTLADARAGIKRDQMDYREINQALPAIRTAASNFKRVLNETDKLGAAGRQAARRVLGK